MRAPMKSPKPPAETTASSSNRGREKALVSWVLRPSTPRCSFSRLSRTAKGYIIFLHAFSCRPSIDTPPEQMRIEENA